VGSFEGGQPDILYVENALGTNEVYIKLWDDGSSHLMIFTAEQGQSANIDVSPDTWYWVTAAYGTTHTLRVYDANGNQVGVERTRTGSAQASTQATLGNLIGDEGGGGPFDFDDWIMDWTDATFPLGPPLASVSSSIVVPGTPQRNRRMSGRFM
jgi:WD40 repeat protein